MAVLHSASVDTVGSASCRGARRVCMYVCVLSPFQVCISVHIVALGGRKNLFLSRDAVPRCCLLFGARRSSKSPARDRSSRACTLKVYPLIPLKLCRTLSLEYVHQAYYSVRILVAPMSSSQVLCTANISCFDVRGVYHARDGSPVFACCNRFPSLLSFFFFSVRFFLVSRTSCIKKFYPRVGVSYEN